MNEVNILNIGGVDYNIDDQLARDVIAHSENGLDPQSNLPISSRHYDEGDYLIGQDRLYYEVTSDIKIGDVIADGVNVRATNISEELVRLKNQSSIAVIQSIAKMESAALASRNYIIGQYFYWDFGLAAGLYETIASITSGDAFAVGVNIKLANTIADTMDGLQDAYNITGAKNLCPNDAVDTVTTDITWDILSDGSIQVSGTAAAQRYIQLNSSITLPAGTYTITTGQANESTADVIMIAQKKSNNEVIARSNSYEYSATFTLAQATDVIFALSTVHTGVAISVRIFPMCRVASITDESYVPYAMTNKQLTERFSGMVRRLLWTGDVYPSTNRVYAYTPTISDILDYDLLFIQGTSGDGAFSILHDTSLEALGYMHTAYEGTQYNTTCQIYVDKYNKRIGIRTYIVNGTGWGETVNHLKNVIGYKIFN